MSTDTPVSSDQTVASDDVSDIAEAESQPKAASDLLPTGDLDHADKNEAQLDDGLAGALEPAELLPTGPGVSQTPDETATDESFEVIGVEDLVYEKPQEDVEPTISPYDMPGKWYVVHTQSGYENKVQQNIESRRRTMGAENTIHDTVIPMEDVVEFKGGKKVTAKKKMFPGYLLVRAELNDSSWDVIRNTPGVTGFVGQGRRGAKPVPLKRKDVENFLQVKTDGEQVIRRTKPRLQYEVGETIRVKEGPFADFSGEVAEINEDQLKVKVLVNIFGRETPVELEFSQVAKL